MNAETRAKEVADGIATRLISGGWVATVYPMIVKDWQNAIAAAITQAQNDKLEEAARLMERVMADSKAALIRTLKTED